MIGTNSYILVITLNMKGLNPSIKDKDWYKKMSSKWITD